MADEDRLSRLPDHVLHHILSFLPGIRERARTAVLSSLWRHVWAHYPDLNFEDLLHPTYKTRPRSYVQAVKRCLENYRGDCLQSLTLHHSWPFYDCLPYIESHYSILCLCLRGNLGYASLDFMHSKQLCSNLRKLSLSELAPLYILSDFQSLPRLTDLTIVDTAISSDILDKLLSTAPVLRNLRLVLRYDSSILLSRPLIIRSRSLRDIHLCIAYFQHGIHVDAPCLESLVIGGYLNQLTFTGIPKTLRVHLSLLHYLYAYKDFDDQLVWMRLVSLISQANTLKADAWFFQLLVTKNQLSDPRAIFKNIHKLNFEVMLVNKPVLHALASILNKCPSLLHLYMKIKGNDDAVYDKHRIVERSWDLEDLIEEDEEEGMQSFKASKPSSHKKAILIKNFKGTTDEIMLIGFLLYSAHQVLKRLTITFDASKSDEEAIQQQISQLIMDIQICIRENKNLEYEY